MSSSQLLTPVVTQHYSHCLAPRCLLTGSKVIHTHKSLANKHNIRSISSRSFPHSDLSIRPANPVWRTLVTETKVLRCFPRSTAIRALKGRRQTEGCVRYHSSLTKPTSTASVLAKATVTSRSLSNLKETATPGVKRSEETRARSQEDGRQDPKDAVAHEDGLPEKPGPGYQATELFTNYRVAYGSKTTWELVRALSFFWMCRSSYLTDNALQLMELCRKVLGRRAGSWLIRKTVYEQFVAGESTDSTKAAISRLRRAGVGPMLCVPMESDMGHVSSPASQDEFFDTNLGKVLESIRMSMQMKDPFPMAQFRFTALMSGDLLTTISPYCLKTMHSTDVMDCLIAGMDGESIDFHKLPGWSEFPTNRSQEFKTGLRRLGAVKDAIKPLDIIALVDAEYTYLNPALRFLCLCLMKVCNQDKARVFSTYQAYLRQTLSNLQQDLDFARSSGFCFALKLVRGAYLVKERQRARDLGYDDPVNATYDLTSANYHNCLDLLLAKVVQDRPLAVRVVIASQNEDTVKFAIKRMEELGLTRDGHSVFFAQLYGMADHVSFTLGHKGYRVYKSIPYGPLDATLPYLARRAQENKSILANARRERQLVAKTLKDRLLFRV